MLLMRPIPKVLWLIATLGACGISPLPPSAALPPGAISGGADPMRSAILASAYVFNTPEAASPQARARAVAMVEYMAADYSWNPRWSEFTPIIGGQLAASRAELRHALAIAPGSTPQRVVTGLYSASRALGSGDMASARTALEPAEFTAPEVTLQRLEAMPFLPLTRSVTSLAERELHRIDIQSHFSGGGDSGAHP